MSKNLKSESFNLGVKFLKMNFRKNNLSENVV